MEQFSEIATWVLLLLQSGLINVGVFAQRLLGFESFTILLFYICALVFPTYILRTVRYGQRDIFDS